MVKMMMNLSSSHRVLVSLVKVSVCVYWILLLDIGRAARLRLIAALEQNMPY